MSENNMNQLDENALSEADLKEITKAAQSPSFTKKLLNALPSLTEGFMGSMFEMQKEAALATSKLVLGQAAINNATEMLIEILPPSLREVCKKHVLAKPVLEFVVGNTLGALFLFAASNAKDARMAKVLTYFAQCAVFGTQMLLVQKLDVNAFVAHIIGDKWKEAEAAVDALEAAASK